MSNQKKGKHGNSGRKCSQTTGSTIIDVSAPSRQRRKELKNAAKAILGHTVIHPTVSRT